MPGGSGATCWAQPRHEAVMAAPPSPPLPSPHGAGRALPPPPHLPPLAAVYRGGRGDVMSGACRGVSRQRAGGAVRRHGAGWGGRRLGGSGREAAAAPPPGSLRLLGPPLVSGRAAQAGAGGALIIVNFVIDFFFFFFSGGRLQAGVWWFGGVGCPLKGRGIAPFEMLRGRGWGWFWGGRPAAPGGLPEGPGRFWGKFGGDWGRQLLRCPAELARLPFNPQQPERMLPRRLIKKLGAN